MSYITEFFYVLAMVLTSMTTLPLYKVGTLLLHFTDEGTYYKCLLTTLQLDSTKPLSQADFAPVLASLLKSWQHP